VFSNSQVDLVSNGISLDFPSISTRRIFKSECYYTRETACIFL